MELSIHYLEPIHTALARLASDLGLEKSRFLRWLFPSAKIHSYAISFPNRLAEVSQRLPSLLRLSGDVIAERHTFLPAVAPFLQGEEFEVIRHRMVLGHKKCMTIPVCFAAGAPPQVIKYCPMCAEEDRSSILPNVRFRMPHLLFGVRACYKHGCTLVATKQNIGQNGALRNADCIVRSDTTRHHPADPVDVEVARDLAYLFSPSCPRPGRERVAAMLHRLAMEHGYHFGASGRIAIVRLIASVREHYGENWLELRGIALPMKADAWPHNLLSANPRLFPAIYSALIGRFLKAPLPTLLKLAMDVKPRTKCWYGRRYSKDVASLGSERLNRSKETIVRKMTENPNATAAKLGSLCGIALNVVRRDDPMWLEANYPARVNITPGVQKYDGRKDALLAHRLEAAARRVRSRQSRPVRVTRNLLQMSDGMSQLRSRGAIPRLPLSAEKLRTLVDDDFSFGKRRVDWLFHEISRGRRKPTYTVGQVLRYTAISCLAKRDLKICDYIRECLRGRPSLPAPYPEALVAEVRASVLDEADDEIAARFCREGRKSVTGSPFSAAMIRHIRRSHNISAFSGKQPGELTVQELSRRFGVRHSVVYYWLNRGILLGRRRRSNGAMWITLSDEKERELYARVKNSKHRKWVAGHSVGGEATAV